MQAINEISNHFKIVLLGDDNTGKTTLLIRSTEGKFRDKYVATYGVEAGVKTVVIKNDKNEDEKVKFNIYDISVRDGLEKFAQYTTSKAQACILTIKLNQPLEKIKKGIQETYEKFKEFIPEGALVYLAGTHLNPNKFDEGVLSDWTKLLNDTFVEAQNHINNKQRKHKCQGFKLLELSNQNSKNELDELFKNIAKDTITNEQEKSAKANAPAYKSSYFKKYPLKLLQSSQKELIPIAKLINELVSEINSNWPYPNKERKAIKALVLLKLYNELINNNIPEKNEQALTKIIDDLHKDKSNIMQQLVDQFDIKSKITKDILAKAQEQLDVLDDVTKIKNILLKGNNSSRTRHLLEKEGFTEPRGLTTINGEEARNHTFAKFS